MFCLLIQALEEKIKKHIVFTKCLDENGTVKFKVQRLKNGAQEAFPGMARDVKGPRINMIRGI